MYKNNRLSSTKKSSTRPTKSKPLTGGSPGKKASRPSVSAGRPAKKSSKPAVSAGASSTRPTKARPTKGGKTRANPLVTPTKARATKGGKSSPPAPRPAYKAKTSTRVRRSR